MKYYEDIRQFFGDAFYKQIPEIMSGILDDVKDEGEVEELEQFMAEHLTELGPACTSSQREDFDWQKSF